ncbi:MULTISPECIES: DUF6082 family protein [unclassified Streptomyces]|uniref:DUF6082 family protein n=1 Tax=unclassified Streptomyces TaxID=2593676 RepID=UPI0032479248
MATQNAGTRLLGVAARTGLGFAAGILTALAAQQLLRNGYGDRHAESTQQRLQLYLLNKALDDPDLAAVLSTVEVESPTQRRQFLFANALYSNALLAYRSGVVTWEELYGYLRITCRNSIFRDYWEATRPHRASLVDTSDEARVGRMMDSLIQDLDDADTDEWWVVGEPPTESS